MRSANGTQMTPKNTQIVADFGTLEQLRASYIDLLTV